MARGEDKIPDELVKCYANTLTQGMKNGISMSIHVVMV